MSGWRWSELSAAERQRWLTPDPEVARFAQELGDPAGKTVYDLGCGLGRHTLHLLRLGFRVYASDIAAEAIRETRALLAQHFPDPDRVRFRVCDMTEAIAPENFFDGIVAFHVIYHAAPGRVRRTLDNLRGMLKPGGLLLVTLKSKSSSDFGKGEPIAEDTFILRSGFEAEIPHHFVDEAGARALLCNFSLEHLAHHLRTQHFPDGSTHTNAHWFALCRK